MTSLFLTLTLVFSIIGGIVVQSSKASAAIYFAGLYKLSARGNTYELEMNKYSSPDGKNVGNFSIIEFNPRVGDMVEGELVKIGTNKYRSQKKGLTFKVYKTKVVVKVSGNRYDKGFKGTYKLTERYSRP